MNKTNSDKARSLVEGVSESTAACLITMVQGNLLSLTIGHLIIASQTGVIAGITTFAVSLLAQVKRRWVIHVLLAIITAIVDFLIHPGSFGGVLGEAILTGIAAGLMSFLVTSLMTKFNSRNKTPQG